MRGMEVQLEIQPEAFRAALVEWFRGEGLDYPWRRTTDPYAVLVSEVMLQQTRIATVLGKGFYRRFLEAFPRVEDLAVADDTSLLMAWEGLGYYRRARMLRDTARAVVERHGGGFPADLAELLALPGIGRYTAGALRAFAFGLPAVLVDGNVARVFSRLTDDATPIDSTAGLKNLWDLAARLADDRHPREYHAGLMELGQTVCKRGKPLCPRCPVARFCRAEEPGSLPVKGRQATVTEVTEHALWARDAEGAVLLAEETGKRRSGLWRLPLRDEAEVAGWRSMASETYTITRYRVRVEVYAAHGSLPCEKECYVPLGELGRVPMAAPFRRLVMRLLGKSD